MMEANNFQVLYQVLIQLIIHLIQEIINKHSQITLVLIQKIRMWIIIIILHKLIIMRIIIFHLQEM